MRNFVYVFERRQCLTFLSFDTPRGVSVLKQCNKNKIVS